MANGDEPLPPCDPFVKAYLLHSVGLAAWISSAQTEYYRRRRAGLPAIVISSPILSQRWLARFAVYCSMILPLVLLLAAILGWLFVVWISWAYLKDRLQDLTGRLVAMGVLLAVGVLVCVAKRRFQSFAGLAEIVVGLVACWAGLGKIADPDAVAVYAIAAGVYLISRGAENVYLGRQGVQAIWREYRTALRWAGMF